MNRFSLSPRVSLLFAALTLAACAAQPAAETKSQPEPDRLAAYMEAEQALQQANLTTVRRFYDEFAAGNADVITEVHPETITMHYAGDSEEVPAQVLRDDLAALKAANPDMHAVIHAMSAAGDYVFTELTWTGTHTGEFFGIPATGKTLVHNGIVVRRLENGKIVESWEIWDDLAFMNSIGYSPSWDELLAAPPATASDQ